MLTFNKGGYKLSEIEGMYFVLSNGLNTLRLNHNCNNDFPLCKSTCEYRHVCRDIESALSYLDKLMDEAR